METKNNVILFSVIFLILGFCVGRFGFSGSNYRQTIPAGNHMMGNGEMMQNGMMDMNGAMGGMMSGLSGKTGDAFDKAFIEQMVVHHEGAVAMAESALKNAKHQEIKDMAAAIISAQTKEIQEMQAWGVAWYGK